MAARHVYVEHMYRLGYGLPLWDPEPRNDEVQIGDLGFITDAGSFCLLFNVTKSAVVQNRRTPEDFKPLSLDSEYIKSIPNEVQAGYLHSGIVKAAAVGAGFKQDTLLTTSSDPAGVGIATAGGDFGISVQIANGGFLILKQSAVRRDALQDALFRRYIKANYRSWYTFARETIGLDLRNRDLILVTGHHKTSSWALAGYSHKHQQAELSFSGQVALLADGQFSVSGGWQQTPLYQAKDGPSSILSRQVGQVYSEGAEESPNVNQTVFLRGFKIGSRRFLAPKKLNAAAEPEDDSRSPPSSPDSSTLDLTVTDQGDPLSESSASVESIPHLSAPSHPLDAVIDHIFVNEPDADLVIVHDDEWPSLNMAFSDYDSVSRALQQHPPRINVDPDHCAHLYRAGSCWRCQSMKIKECNKGRDGRACQSCSDKGVPCFGWRSAIEIETWSSSQSPRSAEGMSTDPAPSSPLIMPPGFQRLPSATSPRASNRSFASRPSASSEVGPSAASSTAKEREAGFTSPSTTLTDHSSALSEELAISSPPSAAENTTFANDPSPQISPNQRKLPKIPVSSHTDYTSEHSEGLGLSDLPVDQSLSSSGQADGLSEGENESEAAHSPVMVNSKGASHTGQHNPSMTRKQMGPRAHQSMEASAARVSTGIRADEPGNAYSALDTAYDTPNDTP